MSDGNGRTSDELVRDASDWWATQIIDVRPGEIRIRGFAIEDLIGNVSFSEMIWVVLRGEVPTASHARLFEAALVSAVDHGPHAPSIAIACMAISCGQAINGAMASAINVLDDVHGGAGQQCMELYAHIDDLTQGQPPADNDTLDTVVSDVLQARRARGERYVPGYGHRWHPLDPRSARLMNMVNEEAATGGVSGRFVRIGTSVERVLSAGRSRPIIMNIDAATAVIYSELGLPPELGRGAFVLSRAVGILAHAWEQVQLGVRMKGPMPAAIPYTYGGVGPRPLIRPEEAACAAAVD